jgi:putative redox protein
MELLLASLGGCTGMSFVDILLRKRQVITGVEIRVEGIVGGETHPKTYTDLEVVYIVRGKGVSPKAVEDAIHLSKAKYCSVSAMLAKTANVRTRFEITPE